MRIRDLIFPPACGACGELLSVSAKGAVPMLCPNCKKGFEREMMAQCKACYLPMADCRCVSDAMAARGCVAHIKLAPFSDTRQPVARALVLTLKKSADKRYYRALATLLLPSLEAAVKAQDKTLALAGKTPISRTVVSFLPRTAYAKRVHGVDQAACLAEALAKALGAPCLPLFHRTHRGLEQKSLSRRVRLQNARKSLVLILRRPELPHELIVAVSVHRIT